MSKWDKSFRLYLYQYFILKDESARDRIDRIVTQSDLEQMKKRQRMLTTTSQVSPALRELLPHCPDLDTAHYFFINFCRINITEQISRNLSELTLMAIAEKHRVAIEHERVRNPVYFAFGLKVYPSKRPRYLDKRDNP